VDPAATVNGGHTEVQPEPHTIVDGLSALKA
jgi:hypothetical protein